MQQSSPELGRAFCVCDYESDRDIELSITTSDVLYIHKNADNGWSYVENSDGKSGWVPTNYLTNQQPEQNATSPSQPAAAAAAADDAELSYLEARMIISDGARDVRTGDVTQFDENTIQKWAGLKPKVVQIAVPQKSRPAKRMSEGPKVTGSMVSSIAPASRHPPPPLLLPDENNQVSNAAGSKSPQIIALTPGYFSSGSSFEGTSPQGRMDNASNIMVLKQEFSKNRPDWDMVRAAITTLAHRIGTGDKLLTDQLAEAGGFDWCLKVLHQCMHEEDMFVSCMVCLIQFGSDSDLLGYGNLDPYPVLAQSFNTLHVKDPEICIVLCNCICNLSKHERYRTVPPDIMRNLLTLLESTQQINIFIAILQSFVNLTDIDKTRQRHSVRLVEIILGFIPRLATYAQALNLSISVLVNCFRYQPALIRALQLNILDKFQTNLKDQMSPRSSSKDIPFVIAQCVKNICISFERVDEITKESALEPLCRICVSLLNIDDLRCWSLSVNSLANIVKHFNDKARTLEVFLETKCLLMVMKKTIDLRQHVVRILNQLFNKNEKAVEVFIKHNDHLPLFAACLRTSLDVASDADIYAMVVIAFFMAKNSDTHDLLSRVNIFQIQAHLKNHPQLSKSYLGIIIFMCESRNVNEDKIESLKQWVKETESALPDLKMFCMAALSGLDQVTKDIDDGIIPAVAVDPLPQKKEQPTPPIAQPPPPAVQSSPQRKKQKKKKPNGWVPPPPSIPPADNKKSNQPLPPAGRHPPPSAQMDKFSTTATVAPPSSLDADLRKLQTPLGRPHASVPNVGKAGGGMDKFSTTATVAPPSSLDADLKQFRSPPRKPCGGTSVVGEIVRKEARKSKKFRLGAKSNKPSGFRPPPPGIPPPPDVKMEPRESAGLFRDLPSFTNVEKRNLQAFKKRARNGQKFEYVSGNNVSLSLKRCIIQFNEEMTPMVLYVGTKKVRFQLIQEVRWGKHTDTLQKCFKFNDKNCFSICYGDNHSYDLYHADTKLVESWVQGIRDLIQEVSQQTFIPQNAMDRKVANIIDDGDDLVKILTAESAESSMHDIGEDDLNSHVAASSSSLAKANTPYNTYSSNQSEEDDILGKLYRDSTPGGGPGLPPEGSGTGGTGSGGVQF